MANNTEQLDSMQQIRNILLKITGEPRDVFAYNGIASTFTTDEIMSRIEAEATRREQAARIDELTSLRAITLSNSVVDDNGDQIHPPTSLDEAVLNRIAELKRQAKGGK